MAEDFKTRPGIYNVEYFSGAQVSLYIGDVWVDEVTSLSFSAMQNRQPIFGYASTLWDDVSQGQFMVQGSFTINFKEAGYLWLIQNRYMEFQGNAFGRKTNSGKSQNPWKAITKGDKQYRSGTATRETVERLVNHETDTFKRNQYLQELASQVASRKRDINLVAAQHYDAASNNTPFATNYASLAGFADNTRASGGMGDAENIYEAFEDEVWSTPEGQSITSYARRNDDPRLNGFDMYIMYGDFAGDNTANHSIVRMNQVHILGKSQQIVIDGLPIQESYQFIARELI